MFVDKTILVTGGTGSFGNAFIKMLLDSHDEFGQIIIFSRDEKKQHDMMRRLDNPKIKFVIGDVRDRDRVFEAMRGVDFVFHAAALKHVPSCEFFPMEAVKTNVIGANNVLDAAEFNQVEKIVVLSTDKAVYPINSMGITKSLMEKLTISKAKIVGSRTTFCGVRYGNVMYSRGSVIPIFVNQIKRGLPLTITSANMTRFLLPLPEAVKLVLFALGQGMNGDMFVKKAPAATVQDLAQSCLNIFSSKSEIINIGVREGEKFHETLVTREELACAEEFEKYYRIPCDPTMRYEQFLTKGHADTLSKEGYNSENTERLTVPQTEKLLLSLEEIQRDLKK